MAEHVRVEVVIEYPLGSPEGYGGETNKDKQIALEREYIEDEGDYLIAVMSNDQATVKVESVEKVWRQR